MSLTLEYFLVSNFDRLKEQKTAIKKMLSKNYARSNMEEWTELLNEKYKQLSDVFNQPELKKLLKADKKGKTTEYLDENQTMGNYDEKRNLYKLIENAIHIEPDFFKIEVMNEVIKFANNCKTADDLKKIWELPKIDDDLDYNKNEYNQFMGQGTKKAIKRCQKIKNTNPVYSKCYAMVSNHYGHYVGLLDFLPEDKKEIDDIVKRSAKFVATVFKKILESNNIK